MADLNGSKTIENLKAAFAGESQANRRYLYFAKLADIDKPECPNGHIFNVSLGPELRCDICNVDLRNLPSLELPSKEILGCSVSGVQPQE